MRRVVLGFKGAERSSLKVLHNFALGNALYDNKRKIGEDILPLCVTATELLSALTTFKCYSSHDTTQHGRCSESRNMPYCDKEASPVIRLESDVIALSKPILE